jgi:hypothetical protein
LLPVSGNGCPFIIRRVVFSKLAIEVTPRKKWVQKEQYYPSEVKWESHNTNIMMLEIGSLNQHIITFCLDLIHDTFYQNQANRRKSGVQHKRIKFPVMKWAKFLVMKTVWVHTLYPPFGVMKKKDEKK